MPAPRTLRPWQRAALEAFEASGSKDFLTVATPGAGKTTFALSAATRMMAQRTVCRLIVVAPTRHLKDQWARAADAFGLHLDADWSERDGAPPDDVHGVVVTYQQVASSPGPLRQLAPRAIAILDEIHHAGDQRAWGDSVQHAFEPAVRRMGLSGTPFRSDDAAIPFVNYVDDEARPDYSYGYEDALEDRNVVRPVYFPRINGHMEWTAPDGTFHAHTFEDALAADLSAQRLRTALALEGEWLPTVIQQAHAQLLQIRRLDPDAGGLAIATDQEHARGIAALMAGSIGVDPVVALSDDPRASERIADYAESRAPWIVAVRMVSEGVDIPRLRVGVYATTTTTDLFFRQAVGRLVRWQAGRERQESFMFIPDDPRLRTSAATIRRQRRHVLGRQEDDSTFRAASVPDTGDADYAQLSMFAAISSVALEVKGLPAEEEDGAPAVGGGLGSLPADVPTRPDGKPARADRMSARRPVFGQPPPDPRREVPDNPYQRTTSGRSEVRADGPSTREFGVMPHRREPSGSPNDERPMEKAPDRESARERRARLRAVNAQRVRRLVDVTGRGHAEVNKELNRRTGIPRIAEASEEQLARRITEADRWLARSR